MTAEERRMRFQALHDAFTRLHAIDVQRVDALQTYRSALMDALTIIIALFDETLGEHAQLADQLADHTERLHALERKRRLEGERGE